MATSATIIIENIEFCKVYKHSDGYPKAILGWLEDFNRDFKKNRGFNPNYKFAQLLRASVRDADKYNLSHNKYTGWGVVDMHEDVGEEYIYLLKNNGDVLYKKVNYDEDKELAIKNLLKN